MTGSLACGGGAGCFGGGAFDESNLCEAEHVVTLPEGLVLVSERPREAATQRAAVIVMIMLIVLCCEVAPAKNTSEGDGRMQDQGSFFSLSDLRTNKRCPRRRARCVTCFGAREDAKRKDLSEPASQLANPLSSGLQYLVCGSCIVAGCRTSLPSRKRKHED